MAETTLKDLLNAIAKLDAKVEGVRSEMATKAETNARFDKVDKQLASLDRDLDAHMDVHRELEKTSER